MKLRVEDETEAKAFQIVAEKLSHYEDGSPEEWVYLNMIDAICNWEEREFHLIEDEAE